MAPIAKALSADQRQAAAAHYASLQPAAAQPPATAASGNVSRGEQLAKVGDDTKQLQSCANCHGPIGQGGGPRNPYLAGQNAGYLVAALAAWRDGSRNTDPSAQMPTVAKALDDQDSQAVAAFFAQLPPPATPRDQDVAPRVASSATAVVSGPLAAGAGQAAQGVGSEQGAPLTGSSQGPGGGATASGGGTAGSTTGSAGTASGPSK
jgi:cytochrome c553